MKKLKTFFLILLFIFSFGVYSFSFAVDDTVTVTVVAPDVQPDTPTFSPSTVYVGDTVTFSDVVTNIGNASTGVAFPYFFQVGIGEGGGDASSRTELYKGRTIGVLAPGATATITDTYVFNAAGTYSIQSVVDKTSRNPEPDGTGYVLTESNENNNRSNWTTIVVNAIPVPPVPIASAATDACISTAGVTTGSITVSWGAVTGATSYNIMIDGVQIGGNITSNSFTHPGLTFGSSHTYQVRANNAGGSSAYSSVVTGIASNLCSYTYYFDGNGATTNPSPASRTLGYSTSITPPTNPSRTGYNFAGWSPAIPATMPVNGGTSYAQWSLENFNLTVNKGGTGSGSVWGGGPYASGSTATAGQSADVNSTFSGWTGCDSNGQVIMNSDKICTANFAKRAVITSLSVSPNPISNGASTNISFNSNYGYYCFLSLDWASSPYLWEGYSGSGTKATPSMTVSGSHIAAVNCYNTDWVGTGWTSTSFTVNPAIYNLTVNTAGTGSGTVGGAGSYASGTLVTATQSANTGSTFSGWSGDCNASGQVTMNANKICTANFSINTYSLSVTKAGTGAGAVTGAGVYNYNTLVTATATPSAGSTFTGWSGDCNASGQVTMNANKSCTATFTLNTYSLTINKIGTGASESLVSGAGTYNHGTVVQANYTAGLNSTFTGWGGDCNASGQVTMDGAKICTARFTLKPVVSLSVSPNPVDFGSSTNITLSATNNPGLCVVRLTDPNSNPSIIYGNILTSNPMSIPTGNLSIEGSYLVTAMCSDTYGIGQSTLASTPFTVRPQLKAPTLSTPTVDVPTLTWDSAVLGATIDNPGNPAVINENGVCLSETVLVPKNDGNPATYCRPATEKTNLGPFTVFTTDLHPINPTSKTTYYFTGYASNDTGTGYSNVGTFEAPKKPEAPKITFAEVDGKVRINSGEFIHLTWTSVDATSCSMTSAQNPSSNSTELQMPSKAISLNQTSIFKLKCNGLGGDSLEKRVTIQVGDIKQVIEEY